MVVDRIMVKGQIYMTQLETTYCLKLWIGEGIDTFVILVIIQIGIMVIIVIILTGGVTGDSFWMCKRKK